MVSTIEKTESSILEYKRKKKLEYSREYNKKFHDKINEAQRLWRKNNPEKIAEYRKRWYKKNRATIAEKARIRHRNTYKRTPRKPVLYSIWDNSTDMPVIIDGTAKECCVAMGISYSSFHPTVTRVKKGTAKKWTIQTKYFVEDDNE